MVAKPNGLSRTMVAPETGETLTRGQRPFSVTYKGESITVELPGYYPAGTGDSIHFGKDMSVVDDALRRLKQKIDGVPTQTLRRK